jgi:hypothetical protein
MSWATELRRSAPTGSRGRPSDAVLFVAGSVVTVALAVTITRRPVAGVVLLTGIVLLAFLLLSWRRVRAVGVGTVLAVGLVSLPLLALLGPSFALPSLPQLFAFRLVLLLVGFVGLTHLIVARRPLPLAAGDIALPLILWFGWTWLGLIWSLDRTVGLDYLAVLTSMIALVGATAAAGATRRRLLALCFTLLAAYVAIVGFTILEARLGLRLPASRYFTSTNTENYAVTSVFRNQNDFATYLAICWPFLLCAFFFTRRVSLLLLNVALMALGAAAFVRTGSRSSLVAVGIASLVGLLLLVHLSTRVSSTTSKIVAGVATLALVVGCGYLLFNDSENEMLRQFRLESLITQAQAGSGSGAIRTDLTVRGLQVAGDTFLAGAGPRQSEVIVASGADAVAIANLHNWWLETYANGGIVGFGLHLVFFLGTLLALWPLIQRDPDPLVRYLASGTFLALLGFVLGALGPSSSVGFTPMWILYGLALAVIARARLARGDAGSAIGASGQHNGAGAGSAPAANVAAS